VETEDRNRLLAAPGLGSLIVTGAISTITASTTT
jgi:hypothetical protein